MQYLKYLFRDLPISVKILFGINFSLLCVMIAKDLILGKPYYFFSDLIIAFPLMYLGLFITLHKRDELSIFTIFGMNEDEYGGESGSKFWIYLNYFFHFLLFFYAYVVLTATEEFLR